MDTVLAALKQAKQTYDCMTGAPKPGGGEWDASAPAKQMAAAIQDYEITRGQLALLEGDRRALVNLLSIAQKIYCHHTCPASGEHEADCQDMQAGIDGTLLKP